MGNRTVWGEQHVALRGKPTYRDEIRSWRESAYPKVSLEQLGEVVDMNRDAVSKIETGKNHVYLDDYIEFVKSFPTRVIPEDHPARALVKLYARRRAPKVLLDDYLACMLFTADDVTPDHPGVALARYLNFNVRVRVE